MLLWGIRYHGPACDWVMRDREVSTWHTRADAKLEADRLQGRADTDTWYTVHPFTTHKQGGIS